MFAPVQPQLSGVVAQAAAAAALFKPGQVLDALVLGKTPDGLVALRIGDLVIPAQLPQALPPGTTLQLQVKSGGPAPQLLLVGTPQLPAQPASVPPIPVLPLPPNAPPPLAVAPVPARVVVMPGTPLPVTSPLSRQTAATGPVSRPSASIQTVPAGTASPSASAAPSQPSLQTPQPTAPVPASPAPAIAESPQPFARPAASIASTPPATRPAPSVPLPVPSATAMPSPPAGQPVPPAPPPAAAAAAPPMAAPTPQSASGGQPALRAPPTVSAPAPPATQPPTATALPPAGALQPATPPPAPASVAPANVAVSAAPPPPTPPVTVQPATVASFLAPEPAAASPLLVAQGAARPPASVADLPRTAPLPAPPQGTAAPAPAPATPAAALAQMVPDALARQNTIAPLMASLAAVAAKPGVLPEPVLRAAIQVLGQRVQLPPGGPTGPQLETAVAKSGVYLEAALARGLPPAADLKSGLVALKGALATWFGGNPAPVTPARQAAPPLRGMPPRAEPVELPPLPEGPREAARALHSQADAALSRLKLMQLASLPDADPARPVAPELRVEVPFLVGQDLVLAQFQVFRDGARRKTEGKRGWTMRFAMTLPAAGEIGAEIGLLGRSVSVALWAADPDTSARLEAALPELAPALAALGLEPGAVRVRNLPPEAPKPATGQYLDSRR